jgi:hypothetical protein
MNQATIERVLFLALTHQTDLAIKLLKQSGEYLAELVAASYMEGYDRPEIIRRISEQCLDDTLDGTVAGVTLSVLVSPGWLDEWTARDSPLRRGYGRHPRSALAARAECDPLAAGAFNACESYPALDHADTELQCVVWVAYARAATQWSVQEEAFFDPSAARLIWAAQAGMISPSAALSIAIKIMFNSDSADVDAELVENLAAAFPSLLVPRS